MFLTIVVACPTVTYWPDKFAGPGQSIRTQWVVFMSIGCSACHVNDTMDHCLFSSRHANETVPLCLLSVVSWYLERWHVACKLLWSGSQSGKKMCDCINGMSSHQPHQWQLLHAHIYSIYSWFCQAIRTLSNSEILQEIKVTHSLAGKVYFERFFSCNEWCFFSWYCYSD